MKALIRNVLRVECNKLISRHYDYLHELDADMRRKAKRLGTTVPKRVKVPPYWQVDDRFNPFKVRRPKKLACYSHTLFTKIVQGTYRPATALIRRIPKESARERELNIYQLPDAALSRLVYKSLLRKNMSLFSSYAYAYREDRDAHDAVRLISSEWGDLDRVYVAEFDFTEFFDQISHAHLREVLKRRGFYYTTDEAFIIQEFLKSRSADMADYRSDGGEVRTRGIPQGTSISLFLANVACWELDRELERLGVGFARYADDTVIWSNDYSRIAEAYEVINECGRKMGVPLNFDKSEGITLVTNQSTAEMRAKSSIEYLGYTIGLGKVGIGRKSVEKLKSRISYLVYQNLIQPLKQEIYNTPRVSVADWDYIVAVSQVRRYLYGGLNHKTLRKYLAGAIPKLNFRGLMTYYPLVDDKEQLAHLDGWLIHVFSAAMRLRQEMWHSATGMALPGPTRDWIQALSSLRSWKLGDTVYDLRIPSFSLINRAMQVAIRRAGISGVAHHSPFYS